jgi:DNA-directed RNA polymerase II subunit RPB1
MAECPGHFGHIELARPVFHNGFLVKVKKILECVCYQCGKLKIDMVSTTLPTCANLDVDHAADMPQRDPAVQNIVRRVKPQHRLKAVWNIARPKNVCEADSLDDEGDATNEDEYQDENKTGQPKGHGGCGAAQPQYRKEALKLTGVFKPSKDKEVSRLCQSVN